MRLIAPGYYSKFKCVGGTCEENCCIGWEIDIDPDTYREYSSLEGELGGRIRENTVFVDGVYRFVTDKQGRCPMLAADGLCDLIRRYGDEALCDICREHPRYYNVCGEYAEVGIGLACPEAARLILTCKDAQDTVELSADTVEPGDECDPELLQLMLSLRYILGRAAELDIGTDGLFALICRYAAAGAAVSDALLFSELDSYDLPGELEKAAEEIDAEPSLSDSLDNFFALLCKIEALDEEWQDRIKTASDFVGKNAQTLTDCVDGKFRPYLIRLFSYFLHRHLPDAVYDRCFFGRVVFSFLSSLAILAISLTSGHTDLPDVVRTATNYSRNVEYSTENVCMLCDAIEDIG